MYDFIIIGGGVTGALIARTLSRYQVKVCLLEKESDIGNHATLANSAIIHAGFDPEPGTLKARLGVRGNAMYETLHKELHVPLLRTGAYVVARHEDDVAILNALYERALKNGVEGAKLLSGEQARKLEPALHRNSVKVLDLPSTKVTYPWEVALSALENAVSNGVEYRLEAEVVGIVRTDKVYAVTLANGHALKSKAIINAAGAFADKVAGMIETHVPYKITPRRGEYLVLDKSVRGFVERVLYPVPTEKGKGVLVVPQVHGNILLGPTSEFQDSPSAVTNHQADLSMIRQAASTLAEAIPFDKVIRTFAGVRATSSAKDFYIRQSLEHRGFYHVAGIDSPGLTAAPAIAEYVVETLIKQDYDLESNPDFNPYGMQYPHFHEASLAKKRQMIAENPAFGNIVCKCERVTEAEVLMHIHRPCGGHSVKAIKKRARAGSGLCQGGYCEGTVVKLLARELKQPLETIDYYRKDTPILMAETKVKR
ncbi:MAG: FAD/NAD(P)-binding oxidoreductase [Acholeplasmatales bacterium]|nr:MAG: FAD/NAD(P)-binding oxidoreductase [Acholeplasmatales bacterium]